jgi:hypothetical protein
MLKIEPIVTRIEAGRINRSSAKFVLQILFTYVYLHRICMKELP